jgi:hypothetical protein
MASHNVAPALSPSDCHVRPLSTVLKQAAPERGDVDDLAVQRIDDHGAHRQVGETGVGWLERAPLVATSEDAAAEGGDVHQGRIARTEPDGGLNGRSSDGKRLPRRHLRAGARRHAADQHGEKTHETCARSDSGHRDSSWLDDNRRRSAYSTTTRLTQPVPGAQWKLHCVR